MHKIWNVKIVSLEIIYMFLILDCSAFLHLTTFILRFKSSKTYFHVRYLIASKLIQKPNLLLCVYFKTFSKKYTKSLRPLLYFSYSYLRYIRYNISFNFCRYGLDKSALRLIGRCGIYFALHMFLNMLMDPC